MACPESADEDLRVPRGAGGHVSDRHRLPGVVDEHLVPGHVHLPQHGLQRVGPRMVAGTERGVPVPGRLLGLVLDPALLEGHARRFPLAVHGGPVRLGPRHQRMRGRGIEARLERRLVELGWQGPRQPRRREPAPVLADGALGHAEGPRDLALAPALVVREAQRLHYLSHGDPHCGHYPSGKESEGKVPRGWSPSAAYRVIDISRNA
jgi:hypothetical protein